VLKYITSAYRLNLPTGGFGFYADVPGSSNPVAIDGAPVALLGGMTSLSKWRVIMKRDKSMDKSPLYERTLEESKYINKKCPCIQIGGCGFKDCVTEAWLVGAPIGDINSLDIQSEAEYRLHCTAHGYRIDMIHSQYNHPTITGMATSPDWLTHPTITTTVQQLDWMNQSLVQHFNKQSVGGNHKIAVAFCINTTGSYGDTIASVIANGDDQNIVIGYQSYDCPIHLHIDKCRLAALENIETSLNDKYGIAPGTATIVPYVLPDHCYMAPAGTVYAGTTGESDMMIVMALDEICAIYDDIDNSSRKLKVSSHFAESYIKPNACSCVGSSGCEEIGSGRQLWNQFKAVEDFKSYSSSKEWGANHVAFPNEINQKAGYDVYSIAHCYNRVSSSGSPTDSMHLTQLALEFEPEGAINPHKAYVESFLGAFATECGIPTVTL